MFSYYTSIIGIVLFLMFIMIIIVRKDSNLGKDKQNLFVYLFVGICILSILEWTGVYLEKENINIRFLHIMVKLTELSFSPGLIIICAAIIGSKKRSNKIMSLLIIHLILEIISAHTGFIFYVTNNNIYVHGEYYWIYILTCLIGIIYLVVETVNTMKKQQCNKKYISYIVILFLITGVVIQLIKPILRISWICISIAVMLFQTYYSQMVFETDILTNLLSRRSYQNHIFELKRAAGIIYFDVDKFKDINDKEGHLSGDRCLAAIGRNLLDVYAQYGYCYRIGGDEFCVILRKKLDSIELLNKEFLEKIEEERLKIAYFPKVSLGYSVFNPKTDKIEDIIDRADTKMYNFKKENKKTCI